MNDFVGLIHDHFTLAELEDLAFDLGIVWDNLPRRGTRQEAVRALVAYCHRNQQIPALLAGCRKSIF